MREGGTSSRTGTGWRHGFFAVLTVVAATGLGLATAELTLRVLQVESSPRSHFRPGIFRSDAELGWALKPDYRGVRLEDEKRTPTQTNSLGFRGPEFDAVRRDADLRVLVLGDSCTFGLGVGEQETWPARLEALLRGRGLDAVVFNAGVPGYDTRQQARTFERVAPAVRPQVVIVTWLQNDALVLSDAELRASRVMDGYLVDDVERYRRWRDKVDERGLYASSLFRFVRVRIRTLRDRLGGRRREGLGEFGPEGLEPSLGALSRIHERARALDARMVLVTLPRREQAEGTQSPGDSDHVAGLYRARGVAVVEGLEVLAASGAQSWRYFLNDNVHLSPLGYDRIARAVAVLPALAPL